MQANFQLLTRDSNITGGLQLPFTHCQTADNIVSSTAGRILPPLEHPVTRFKHGFPYLPFLQPSHLFPSTLHIFILCTGPGTDLPIYNLCTCTCLFLCTLHIFILCTPAPPAHLFLRPSSFHPVFRLKVQEQMSPSDICTCTTCYDNVFYPPPIGPRMECTVLSSNLFTHPFWNTFVVTILLMVHTAFLERQCVLPG